MGLSPMVVHITSQSRGLDPLAEAFPFACALAHIEGRKMIEMIQVHMVDNKLLSLR